MKRAARFLVLAIVVGLCLGGLGACGKKGERNVGARGKLCAVGRQVGRPARGRRGQQRPAGRGRNLPEVSFFEGVER